MKTETRTLYSPRIADRLIPQLYRLARARGIPMTRLVDQLLERALATEHRRRKRAGVATGGWRKTDRVPQPLTQ